MATAQAIAASPDRASPRYDPSAAGDAPAVRARVRLSRMIWDTVANLGVVASGVAALPSLLIDESSSLQLVSAFAFAAVPAVAALLLGAMLVAVLRLLGIAYDLVRILLLPGLVRLCFGAAARAGELANRHRRDLGRALVRGARRLIGFARAGIGRVGRILGRERARARSALAWLGREAALDALWAKRHAERLLRAAPVIAGWPIRSSARLILGLIERRPARLPMVARSSDEEICHCHACRGRRRVARINPGRISTSAWPRAA